MSFRINIYDSEFHKIFIWYWLFQKISTSYGPHWIGHPKILGFPRMTAAVYVGFQTLMIQVLGAGILKFCKILNDFPEILVKIYKIFGKLMRSVRLTKHPGFLPLGLGGRGHPLKRFCPCKFKILPLPPKKTKKHPFLKNTSRNL